MLFNVGPWAYTAMVSAFPLTDEGGRSLAGRIDFEARSIRISPDLLPEVRLETLLHELRHCWLHHFGRPVDEESDCDTVATWAVSVLEQLESQGGIRSLRRQGAGPRAERPAMRYVRDEWSQCA